MAHDAQMQPELETQPPHQTFHANGRIKYEGQARNGEPWGQGKLFDAEGNLLYDGAWAAGVPHGAGKFNDGIMQCEGTFKEGAPHGKGHGSLKHANGVIAYQGDFFDGVPEGTGELFDTGGNLIYRGQIRDGKSHGQGKGRWGTVWFEGEYIDGIPNEDGACRLWRDDGKLLMETAGRKTV